MSASTGWRAAAKEGTSWSTGGSKQFVVADVEYDDFVSWTLNGCTVLRAASDPLFWNALLKKAPPQVVECMCQSGTRKWFQTDTCQIVTLVLWLNLSWCYTVNNCSWLHATTDINSRHPLTHCILNFTLCEWRLTSKHFWKMSLCRLKGSEKTGIKTGNLGRKGDTIYISTHL